MKILSMGYSPCPNDTYIFYALANGRITAPQYRFEVLLADVEELNRRALARILDVTKISVHAVLQLLDDYWLLRSGGALGRGCGPLVVAREAMAMEDLRLKSIAIPGKLTTAHLLLKLNGIHRGRCIEMPFDRIMPAVAAGEADAGVVIHEGRFTFANYGLKPVLDLGAWWEADTGLPLPLGAIAIKRSLGPECAVQVESAIKASLVYSRAHPDEASPYIRQHAQEMETAVIQRHIDTFVNDFTLNAGKEGMHAVNYLLRESCRLERVPFPSLPVFRE
jgi:1,4-dihydroxy-6-naphthoate synthase